MNYLVVNLYNMFNVGELNQVKSLRSLLLDDTFTIASIYSIIDKDACVKNKIGYVGADKPGSIPSVLSRFIRIGLQAIMVWAGIMRPKGIIKAFNDCDAVIDMGGDTFSDDVTPFYTLIHSYSLIIARIMGKPYVICSQSIGKFKTPITKWLAFKLIKGAEFVWCRERVSAGYVGASYYPDVAFNFIRQVSKPKDKSVGIITACMSKRQTKLEHSEYLRMLYGIAKRCYAAGYKVVLIPWLSCQEKSVGVVRQIDDAKIAHELKELLGDTAVIGCVEDIKRMSVIVSARFHACVHALSMGVPAVGLSWGMKFAALDYAVGMKIAAYDSERVYLLLEESIKQGVDIECNRAAIRDGISAMNAAIYRYYGITPETEMYYAFASDKKIRKQSASGGVVTALIGKGTQDSLYHIRTPQNNGVSLPCNINMRKNGVTIGLVCSHAIYERGIKRMCGGIPWFYKYKFHGEVGLLYPKGFIKNKAYWSKFFNLFYIPKPCRRCKDLLASSADITVGDAHGHPHIGRGINVVIARTELGRDMFNRAIEDGRILVTPITLRTMLSTQPYYRVKVKPHSLKTHVYLAIRTIGCFISDHDKIFAPIITMWLHLFVYPARIDTNEDKGWENSIANSLKRRV